MMSSQDATQPKLKPVAKTQQGKHSGEQAKSLEPRGGAPEPLGTLEDDTMSNCRVGSLHVDLQVRPRTQPVLRTLWHWWHFDCLRNMIQVQ
ncbi:hypothetical protein Y1Q_0015596 [Alligator mississippiensis]|uniref:Uncharacterized protein n=1 Tax=Alligator mississippiensis TaxID=8496 RepID=A0A151NNB4_ALLMI|nr:hypothetical protein Y1Q_0015596 [Alligator mississippiensis]